MQARFDNVVQYYLLALSIKGHYMNRCLNKLVSKFGCLSIKIFINFNKEKDQVGYFPKYFIVKSLRLKVFEAIWLL